MTVFLLALIISLGNQPPVNVAVRDMQSHVQSDFDVQWPIYFGGGKKVIQQMRIEGHHLKVNIYKD